MPVLGGLTLCYGTSGAQGRNLKELTASSCHRHVSWYMREAFGNAPLGLPVPVRAAQDSVCMLWMGLFPSHRDVVFSLSTLHTSWLITSLPYSTGNKQINNNNNTTTKKATNNKIVPSKVLSSIHLYLYLFCGISVYWVGLGC